MISTKDMYDSLRPKRTKKNIIITASIIAVIVLIILYNILCDFYFIYTIYCVCYTGGIEYTVVIIFWRNKF